MSVNVAMRSSSAAYLFEQAFDVRTCTCNFVVVVIVAAFSSIHILDSFFFKRSESVVIYRSQSHLQSVSIALEIKQASQNTKKSVNISGEHCSSSTPQVVRTRVGIRVWG